MKDILVPIALLIACLTQVCPLPYKLESGGSCQNPDREYLFEGSNLCCQKCQPGQRLVQDCSETAETVCEPCEQGQYRNSWNYATNCFSCLKCKSSKGLQYAQNCTATSESKCICQSGWYCTLGFDNPYCAGCAKYKTCRAGSGVSKPGTATSNPKCKQCPAGTFSDTESYRDTCQPHTQCHGRAVYREGNATSDTVCEPEAPRSSTQPQTPTKELRAVTVLTTPGTMIRTFSMSSAPTWGLIDSTQSVRPSVSEPKTNYPTKSPPLDTGTVMSIVITVIVLLFLLFFIIVLYLTVCKKEKFHPEVDANGNCESGGKISQGYFGETLVTSITLPSPEQQCLLETGKTSSDHSQCSNNCDTLTRTKDSNSYESICPLQSTVALNSSSALSEPLPLISNSDPVTPQPSIFTQSSSQPTSPQIITPVTTSPHVNVNITFHIGNGTCGTPSVIPTDARQTDCKLPFGEEEESFSIPKQEDGKQSLMSVEECSSYMYEESPA